MRRTQILFQQHSGRMFREKWQVQGKLKLIDNGALKQLKLNGIPYEDANEVIKEVVSKRETQTSLSNLKHFPPQPITMVESHPDYHNEPCLMYSDHNVLVGGLDQAKVFTNSYEMELSALPLLKLINDTELDPSHAKLVKRCISASLLYDATQEKLPRRTDPERPAFRFPRDYGIPDKRRNYLLGKRLIQLCSSLSPEIFEHRRVFPDAVKFQAALQRNERNVLLCNMADLLVTSSLQIDPIVDKSETEDMPLPNIYPLSPLISLESHHIYKFEDFFPINKNFEKSNVHTVIVHFNKTEVSNLFETEVTETQILARSLMKCYTYALAQAKHNFGNDVEVLPKPIVVQCIQTDSKMFHFSVLQLNTTLSPEHTNIRNAYWNMPLMDLYQTCDYVEGKPQLIGYNALVFKTILGFFKNS